MNKTIEYLDSEKLKYTISDDGLITIHGNVCADGEVDLEGVEAITGSVHVHKNASLTANALTSIGTSVHVNKNAKLKINSLTSIGGYGHTEMIIDFIIVSIVGTLVALIPIWLGYNITNWQFWLVLPVNFAIGYYWDNIKDCIRGFVKWH